VVGRARKIGDNFALFFLSVATGTSMRVATPAVQFEMRKEAIGSSSDSAGKIAKGKLEEFEETRRFDDPF